MTLTVLIVIFTPHQTQNDYHEADKIIEVKLSNMKYAANFPTTINKNNTIFLFDTGATISSMSKAWCDKLQPKPSLVLTHTYKANGADGNSLGPLRMTTCTRGGMAIWTY